MFNKRLQHDFIIPNEGLYRVYLLEESDTGGEWPVIKGEGEPVKLPTGNPNNKIYTPILPGILTWRIVIRNQAERDVIDAVFESIEGDYRVEYYQVEGGITENLIWRGDLLLDQYNEDLRGFPGFVEIVASDLGKLQGLNYLDIDGFPHTGRESQLQIIKNCVQLLGYDLGFACSDAIYEDTMDGDPLTDDPMLQAYADNAWYYPVDSFGQTRLMSAWDVLRSILVSKACRIRQWGGRWHIEQIGPGVEPIPVDPIVESNGLVLMGRQFGTFRILDSYNNAVSVANLDFPNNNTILDGIYLLDGGKVAIDSGSNSLIRCYNEDNSFRWSAGNMDFRSPGKMWVHTDGYLYLAGLKASSVGAGTGQIGTFLRIDVTNGDMITRWDWNYNDEGIPDLDIPGIGGARSICVTNINKIYASVADNILELDYETLKPVGGITFNPWPNDIIPSENGSFYVSTFASSSRNCLYKLDNQFNKLWERLSGEGQVGCLFFSGEKLSVATISSQNGRFRVYDIAGLELANLREGIRSHRLVGMDTFGSVFGYAAAQGTNINRGLFYDAAFELIYDVNLGGDLSSFTSIDVHPGRCLNYYQTYPTPDVYPPWGVLAVPGNSQVALTWNVPIHGTAAGYNVYVDDVKVNNSLIVGLSYLVESLTNGQQYKLQVSSVTSGGFESVKSFAIFVTPFQVEPPINVTVTPFGGGLKIEWDPPATGVAPDTYNVYFQGETQPINTGPIPNTDFVVFGLTVDTEYCFFVTALKDITESAGSSVVCKTTEETMTGSLGYSLSLIKTGFRTDEQSVLLGYDKYIGSDPVFDLNNFEQYADGQFPADWLNNNNGAGFAVLDDVLTSIASPSNACIFSNASGVGATFKNGFVRMKAKTQGTTSANRLRMFARSFSPGTFGIRNGYWVALREGTTFEIARVLNDTFLQLTATAFSYSADTYYHLELELNGSTLNAKVWADGDAKPATPTLTTTDATHTIGFCGVGGNTHQLEVDTFELEPL